MLPYILAGIILFISISYFFFLHPRTSSHFALDPTKFQSFTLIDKIPVSPDSYIFRFALQSPTQRLGLPIGQHITIRANIVNVSGSMEVVQHPYTPITSDDDVGFVEFLIKVYRKNQHPSFPYGGRLSQHLLTLPLGAGVEMRGPVGKFTYLGNGHCIINKKEEKEEKVYNTFAMIAGGTGITPMMQLIRAIMKNPHDRTRIFLVYSNHTENDILLKEELDTLVKQEVERMHVWYTITRDTPPDWKFSTGRLNEEILREHLPVLTPKNENNENVLALMCGPAQMIQSAVKPNLEKMGYTADNMFTF